MRNRIYTVVIVVSAVAVAVIVLMTRPASTGGIESIPEGQRIWVKCTQCGATYQMGTKGQRYLVSGSVYGTHATERLPHGVFGSLQQPRDVSNPLVSAYGWAARAWSRYHQSAL